MERLQLEFAAALRLLENEFLRMPLESIGDWRCWLAIFLQEPKALQVDSFVAALQRPQLQVNCVDCSSEGLPSLISSFSEYSSTILQSRIPALAQDLMMSEWLQDRIQHEMDWAPHQCRSSNKYDVGAARPSFEGFPRFNEESLDALSFFGVSGVWIAALSLSQDVVAQPEPSPTNVLQAELDFVPPSDASLLDWSQVGESTGWGSVADDALERVREVVSDMENTDDGIVRDALDNLLGDSNVITIDTGDLVFEQDGFRLSIDSVSVTGLDRITALDILRPMGKYTLGNTISIERATVDLQVSMGYTNDGSESRRQLQASKTLSLQVQLDQVDIDATVFAVFNVDRLRALPLGSFLLTGNILPCLLSSALDVQLPQLIVNVGSFTDVIVEGLDDDTDQAMRPFLDATLNAHRTTLEAAIPRVMQGALGGLASTAISDYVQEATCPSAIRSEGTGIVDLRELLLSPSKSVEYGGEGSSPYGNLFSTLLELVRDEVLAVDEATGLSKINEMLLRPLTEDQSGSEGKFVFEGELFDRGTKIDVGGLRANVRLRIADVFVSTIDTFGEPLVLLENVLSEPHQVNNSAILAEEKPLDLGVRFLVELVGDGKLLSTR